MAKVLFSFNVVMKWIRNRKLNMLLIGTSTIQLLDARYVETTSF